MGKLFAGYRFFSGGLGVDIGENIVDASVIIFNYYFSVFCWSLHSDSGQ